MELWSCPWAVEKWKSSNEVHNTRERAHTRVEDHDATCARAGQLLLSAARASSGRAARKMLPLDNQADPALRGVTTEQFRAQVRGTGVGI